MQTNTKKLVTLFPPFFRFVLFLPALMMEFKVYTVCLLGFWTFLLLAARLAVKSSSAKTNGQSDNNLNPDPLPEIRYRSAPNGQIRDENGKQQNQSVSDKPASLGKSPRIPQELATCDAIDVVYTWVNGTDPDFLKEFSKYRKVEGKSLRRVRDYGTLQFSVRSIEKYAPWIRRVHFITNGQIPTWLDTTNPRYASVRPFLFYFILNYLWSCVCKNSYTRVFYLKNVIYLFCFVFVFFYSFIWFVLFCFMSLIYKHVL